MLTQPTADSVPWDRITTMCVRNPPRVRTKRSVNAGVRRDDPFTSSFRDGEGLPGRVAFRRTSKDKAWEERPWRLKGGVSPLADGQVQFSSTSSHTPSAAGS